MDLDLNVIISNRDAITSSLTVAKAFRKRHTHVLRKIDDVQENWAQLLNELSPKMGPVNTELHPKTDAALKELSSKMSPTNTVFNPKIDSVQGELSPDIGLKKFKDCFFETEYLTEDGRSVRSFNLNRDGFMLLTMGFNGRDALRVKLMFLDRFNAQEKELAKRSVYYDLEKQLRKRLTDTIRDYGPAEKSEWEYSKLTNLLYMAAAGHNAEKLKRDRGLNPKVSAFADALTSVERDKYIDAENQLIIAYSTGTTDYYVLKDMLLEKKSA